MTANSVQYTCPTLTIYPTNTPPLTPYSPHQEGQTSLHISARLGNVDTVQLLLQHNASPIATTVDAYTPLHIAAKVCRPIHSTPTPTIFPPHSTPTLPSPRTYCYLTPPTPTLNKPHTYSTLTPHLLLPSPHPNLPHPTPYLLYLHPTPTLTLTPPHTYTYYNPTPHLL